MNQVILRNERLEPLSVEQMRKFSPAIFAKHAHPDVSSRYGYMPTYTVLEHMHKAGFVPVEVRNYMRRTAADMRFTKHMIRFRQAGALQTRVVGDVVPQVVLLNSHDRSSPYSLMGGLFRLICLNGLLVAEGAEVTPIKLRHTLSLAEQVVEVSLKLLQHHKAIFTHVNAMRKTTLTDRQQLVFASKALELRFESQGALNAAELLTPRRPADQGDDLWRVFNRVQENMLKGGLHGKTKAGRATRTTPINGINADIKYNAGLWALAMAVITKAQASSKRVVEGKVLAREVA